jgi:hypothetical protein
MLSGCSSIISSATGKMAANLSTAITNNDDLATVKAGAPAYLLLLDSFIEADPKDADILVSAASLNSAYASVFVKDEQRAKRLTQKSLDFALRASCLKLPFSCDLQTSKFSEFEKSIKRFEKQDIELLFTLGASWAGWIQNRSGDWNAAATLAQVTTIMQHVVSLDEKYKFGQAHLYLGVLNTILPPALGGKPEIGQQHFEKAIAISNGKNLMAKVLYAEKYARLVFDQPLHDRLLNEVLNTDPHMRNFTLTNMLAQNQAETLLASSKDYF